MDPCAINMAVSALACSIAKDKSNDELALLSAFFTQLGDSLTTIVAAKICGDDTYNSIAKSDESKEI